MNRRLLILVAILAAASPFGLILLLIAPRAFFALLNLLGIVFLILGALTMVVTLRKAKAVKPFALAIPAGMGLLTAIVVSAFTPSCSRSTRASPFSWGARRLWAYCSSGAVPVSYSDNRR